MEQKTFKNLSIKTLSLNDLKELKNLTDDELHIETLRAADVEKKSTFELLKYLHEVEVRRVYALRGYESLWEYSRKYLGYSETQTRERLSAMRLVFNIPEVAEKLAQNQVSLTTVAKLAAHVKRENTKPAKVMSLLEKVAQKPSREVERILISEQKNPMVSHHPVRMRVVTAEMTELKLQVDEEFMELLERAK